MKVETSVEKFHDEWKATGDMIHDTPHGYSQTYSHPRFEGKYTQKRIETPLGTRIEMTEVTK